MPFPPKGRVFNQFPYDPALGDQSKQALDWMMTQLNQLIGQANAPPSSGLQSVTPNTIDPTSGQIASAGARVASITTALAWTATTTTVTFFWDGTNGSQVFKIGRDDGTVYTNPTGSGLVCSGLVANTKYFFYPFFNEGQQVIQFASVPGVATGSPAIAFTSPNFKAAQQQILRGNLPLGVLLITTGVTTPNAGSTSGSGGTGGGGVGGGVDRGQLL